MNTEIKFSDLGLPENILSVLDKIGYEIPSPIQAEAIPPLLAGNDILGQAQTGTGKTAAFALPALANVDVNNTNTQVLVLAPTRELAIQVAEAFQTFARATKGLHVLPIYGGAEYGGQIRALKRGAQVVVGTPGRVMDHMRKGTLKLNNLKLLVLDEADEMLRMGFIDDVRWVLDQTPDSRQIALFSATMPKEIHKIASKYLNNPTEVIIKQKTGTAVTIEQKYLLVSGPHKLDALTRVLEAETFDGVIIFVRTKTATVELAEKLEARGYASAALNGDIAQNHRERIVNQLKQGKIDILIATDVVARGLDVERISMVINYDIPQDAESYVHRIGRTGRAGRQGKAILFVAPRERRLLSMIERTTKKKINQMHLPSTVEINNNRIERFKARIIEGLEMDDLDFYQDIIQQIENEQNVPAIEIAAATARLLQGDVPFFLEDKPEPQYRDERPRRDHGSRRVEGKRNDRRGRRSTAPNDGMERYRINVGRQHGVKPGNIVGCIANEAGLESEFIQKLNIEDSYSTVDLPERMPKEVLATLRNAWVCGQRLDLQLEKSASSRPRKSFKESIKSKRR